MKKYAKDKKKQLVDDLKDKIKAIEKFAKDKNLNKDEQVKQALETLGKLFKEVRK